MPAGIQILSDSDVITIDGQHFNYEFTRKGVNSGNLNFSSNRGAMPLVFIRASTAGFGKGLVTLGNGNYRYEWEGSYSYWIFEPPLQPSGGGVGIQVFDESGSMVYTTDIRPMRINQMHTYTRRSRIYSNQGYYISTRSPQITSPVASVAVINANNMAYAPAFPECSGLRTIGLGRDRGYDFETKWLRESFITTSSGFEVGEIVDTSVVGLLESGYYPPMSEYSPPWLSLPGIVLSVDISGL